MIHGSELRDFNNSEGAKRAGWRMRIGRYRIIYDIDDFKKQIVIMHIGHRRDVYR